MYKLDTDAIAADPQAHGFHFSGYAVRAPDGRYVRELRVLQPRAGLDLTRQDSDARVWPQQQGARWLAGKIDGAVVEAWDGSRQRLMRWGAFAMHQASARPSADS